MIRLPSNQHHYDEFWSGDEAFVQLVDNPLDGAREEHERRWRVARETGNYDELRVSGAQPTKFTFRPLPTEVFRRLVDELAAGKIGTAQLLLIAFRSALVDVVNLGDVKVKHVNDAQYGRLAGLEIAQLLDQAAPGCIAELADRVLERARGLSGK